MPKKPSFSTVVSFMSDEAQQKFKEDQGGDGRLPLESIRPDPDQPRSLLPTDLIVAVIKGEMLPAVAVQEWIRYEKQPDAPQALKNSIKELRRLADSIAQHGLINPVTVRPVTAEETLPPSVKYVIVTGERRYWAHVLLAAQGHDIQEGNTIHRPSQIKATVTVEGISVRAHQLIENLVREDLNAVERAEGLWALRYELSGVPYGEKEKLVPWREVEEKMGMSKRHRIRLTSVLDLVPDVREQVMTHDLTERAIRPVVQRLRSEPDLQRQAVAHLVALQNEDEGDHPVKISLEHYIAQLLGEVPMDTAVGESEEPESEERPSRIKSRRSSSPTIRRRVRGALKYFSDWDASEWSRLNEEQQANVKAEMRTLRQRLDELLGGLDG